MTGNSAILYTARMRRPSRFAWVLLASAAVSPLRAATLPPSADPVASFIAVADSVARTEGDAGLSTFVRDNSLLVGAAVANLLDGAFQVAEQGNAAGEKENIVFAMRVATAYESVGGTRVPRSLVDTYERWTPAKRKTRAQAIKLEEEAAAARKAGDVPKAVSLFDEARKLYERIGDRHSVAVNWGSMGVAHFAIADWDAVIADYEKALVARRAVEDRILEGRTLNGLGSAHFQKGQYDQSIDFYQQAVDLRRKTGDAAGLGTSLTYLANVYARTGRLVDARTQYEEALPILETLGSADQMIDLHIGMANLASDMGRMSDADQSYQQAILLAVANGVQAKEIPARNNLASNYRQEGRITEALEQFAAVQPLLDANPNPTETVAMLRERGVTYIQMGELDKARDDLLACAEIAKTLDDPLHMIEANINIGQLYAEMGAYDRALKSADQARQLAESAGDARRYRAALVLRAELERLTGQYETSLATWKEALAQDEADGATVAALQDGVGIGGALASLGRSEEARAHLRALLPIARDAKQPYLVSTIQLSIGHTFEKQSPDSAAAYYEQALHAMEGVGAGIGDASVHTGYLSSVRYFYEEIARFYAETYQSTGDRRWSERSFHTIERAKARGLLELLEARVAQTTSPEEGEVLDALYSLDPTAADYAEKRSALEERYAELRAARVSSAMGGLAHDNSVVTLAALSQQLPKKTAMVAYALGDTASFAWVIDRSGYDLVRLPARSVITADVRRFRDALAHLSEEAALRKSSRGLYTMLLGPLEARLAKVENAVIVPDGVLFEIPFEALLTAEPKENDPWKRQPFFMRRTAILYAPSATVYVSLKAKPAKDSFARDLLAMGNPDFSALAPTGDAKLAPLPFAQEEVDAISARVKDDRKLVLTGGDAREATLKKELRNGAPRVLHLATHGLVDPVEPTRSSVALTPGDNEDGYFHTLEILATPVPSELVVMSACESARGQLSRGEGVVGLSRAFLASGAGSVVASLWAVSDESTALLMKTLYERMFGKKRSATRALNEARMALIDSDKYSHPFFWSPFIVTGTERAPW
jgi:CHAT domain-containing protein/lipopolysaccharide biosynthesis regulator YciM